MKRLLALLAVLAVPIQPAAPEMAPDLEAQILAAFDLLTSTEDVPTGDFLIQHLSSEELAVADWQALFRAFFETHPFTDIHGRFWDYALGFAPGPAQDRVATVSGYWAGEAVRAGLLRVQQGAATDATLIASSTWIQGLAPGLSTTGRTDLFTTLEAAFAEYWAGAMPVPERGAHATPMWIELAIALGRCAPSGVPGRERVSAMLALTGSALRFWEARGVFLFDDGRLDESQALSLNQLMAVIPPDLHEIAAIVVPDAGGQAPALSGLAQVILVPAIPMSALSNPAEFTPRVGQPVASEFTLVAAQQIVRAIQDTQFARRPGLVARRDAILMRAGTAEERYLRRFIPPAVYLNQPDELLPAVAYLWFIDTERTFQTALDLFELEKRDAMDSFLLFADLMSGGGNETPIYRTDDLGRAVQRTVPIGRTWVDSVRLPDPGEPGLMGDTMPVNANYVTAIALLGSSWRFDLNPLGGTIRWNRR
ncbi:MAG: hypothetical protein JXR94_17965 [Candidatus Hydrogenedentes bacterium]|nr:hypothetical protein [Candidatus Hydrogenedentota bacterium]